MAKAWKRAYSKASGISAKKGIKRVAKSSGMTEPQAKKAIKTSGKAIAKGMQAQMKGTSSKKAVRKAASKVTARTGMTGKAATRQARRIVRTRKALK